MSESAIIYRGRFFTSRNMLFIYSPNIPRISKIRQKRNINTVVENFSNSVNTVDVYFNLELMRFKNKYKFMRVKAVNPRTIEKFKGLSEKDVIISEASFIRFLKV